MLRRSFQFIFALVLLLGIAVPMVWAQRGARLQLARTRQLKACIGILPTLYEPDPGIAPLNPWFNASVTGDENRPDPDGIIAYRSPNPNPYLFQVLNERKDMLPDGWEIINPAAPAFVTQAQRLRWEGFVTGVAGSLRVGSPLTPDVGAYWEVTISQANYNRLAEMDVIYLPIARDNNKVAAAIGTPVPTFFTEEQRRVLTTLAHSGVTVWVDWALPAVSMDGALGGLEPANPAPENRRKNPFFTNLDFTTVPGTAQAPLVEHPLLNAVYTIGAAETLQLGSPWGSPGSQQPSLNRAVYTRARDAQPNANYTAVVPTGIPAQDPRRYAYVAAARFGAGFVVASAGNIGGAISTWTNRGVVGGPLFPIIRPDAPRITNEDINLADTEDLKFAYNVFGWAAEVTAAQKNSQHTGQSPVQLNGVIEQYNYPYLVKPAAAGQPWVQYPPASIPTNQLVANPTPPLVLNGVIIAQNRYRTPGGVASELNAFEANPNENFDRDPFNFLDDPIQANTPAGDPMADFSVGQPYDRIMGLPIPGNGFFTGFSVGEVPESLGGPGGSGGSKAYVFAAGSTGLFSLPAPRPNLPPADYWSNPGVVKSAQTNGLNVQYTGAPGFINVPGPPDAATGIPTVSSLLVSGGINQAGLFGSSTNGKVVAFDVAPDGGMFRSWYYPGNQESNRLGAISGPVTIAQLQDVATGAVDSLAFTTSVSSGDLTGGQAGGQGGDSTGRVDGYILATKGEPLALPPTAAAPNAANPAAGRRFIPLRLVDSGRTPQQPGTQTGNIEWDATRHFEVRVMDRAAAYVLARFVPGATGFRPLSPASAAGVVELPAPTGSLSQFSVNGQGQIWDTDRFLLMADYSIRPQAIDTGGRILVPTFQPPTPYVRSQAGGAQNQVPPTGVAGGVAVGRDNLVYYGTGIGYMCAAELRRGRPAFRWKVRALEYDDNGGQSRQIDPNQPDYVQDFVFSAAPAAGDRIIFASKGLGANQGTVYVLEPNATVRFKLPVPSLTPAQAQELRLEADHGTGVQPNDPFLRGDEPAGRARLQFSVDPDAATVTFLNMENFSLDLRRALSPSQLPPGVDTGGRPAVPINFRIGRMGPVLPAFVPLPLVAIYRTQIPQALSGTLQPEQFFSGPTIAGNRIYMMGSSGYIHEFPLDPQAVEPRFPDRTRPGLTGYDLGTLGIRRLRNVAAIPGIVAPAGIAPVTVSEGMIIASTRRGMTVFSSPNVVVADSNRIVETSGDSAARVSLDTTLKRRMDSSEFPIPTDPQLASTGGRPLIQEQRILSRPAVVRKLNRASSLTALFYSTAPVLPDAAAPGITEHSTPIADESYLIAETGNSRCVEVNPAGNVIWELTSFQDPFGLIPSGEPLRLSGPTDVSRWIEEEAHPTLGRLFVVHTLVADPGNTRIVEIVDKIRFQRGTFTADSFVAAADQTGPDGTPIRWYHVVVWASQTNAQGVRLPYRTAQRLFWADANGDRIPLPGVPSGLQRAETQPPFLPPERFLGYTMASISGQQVTYGEPEPVAAATRSVLVQYFRLHQVITRQVAERRPDVRPGGDSVVFLRGRWRVDEGTGLTPRPSLFREPRVTSTGMPVTKDINGDSFRFGQGVIDPNVPILNEIWDEVSPTLGPVPPLPGGIARPVHRLSGVTSVQRTARADGKFAPDTYNPARPMVRAQFFLIADQDGVWEARMLPGANAPGGMPVFPLPVFPGASQAAQFRLAWAFTADDYAYVTGAGNGDPNQLYSPAPANHTPGGRQFTAASARRFPNGYVLICSPTPANENPPNPGLGFRHRDVGADVLLLRSLDYTTVEERRALGQTAPFNFRRNQVVFHGWRPDVWVQQTFPALFQPGGSAQLLVGGSSIRWRAAEALNPFAIPGKRVQADTNPMGSPTTLNPYDLSNSYIPAQPAFAELLYQ